jgi:hypothetical protein
MFCSFDACRPNACANAVKVKNDEEEDALRFT